MGVKELPSDKYTRLESMKQWLHSRERAVFYLLALCEFAVLCALIYFWTHTENVSWFVIVLVCVLVVLALIFVAVWVSLIFTRLENAQRLPKISSLSKQNKQMLVLISVFYVGLFVAIVVTGTMFEDDWAVVVVAALPLVLFIINRIAENFELVKAKFPWGDIELRKVIARTPASKVSLRADASRHIPKGTFDELGYQVKFAKTSPRPPRVLVVDFGKHNFINLAILRQYVYDLSAETPLEHIVFTESGRYLGFLSVQRFKSIFPEISLDWLNEIQIQELSAIANQFQEWDNLVPRLERVLEELRDLLSPSLKDIILKHAAYLYAPGRMRSDALAQYGVLTVSISETTVFEAYKKLNHENLEAIPIVDNYGNFIDILTFEDILHQIMGLVEVRRNTQE